MLVNDYAEVNDAEVFDEKNITNTIEYRLLRIAQTVTDSHGRDGKRLH